MYFLSYFPLRSLAGYAAMYIRRTKIKTGQQGEPYFTYRIVESVRADTGVKQRTMLILFTRAKAIKASNRKILSRRLSGLIFTKQANIYPIAY